MYTVMVLGSTHCLAVTTNGLFAKANTLLDGAVIYSIAVTFVGRDWVGLGL